MNLRSLGTHVFGAAIILASATAVSNAQSSSATHVAAEMTKGKLNPADSKPGDTVALKLKDDVKSNGEVVLKKGTTITGVVRNVKSPEANGAAKGASKSQAQSMMEIEWLAPAAQGRAAQNVSIALQSVTQVNPPDQHEQNPASGHFVLAGAGATTSVANGQPNTALLSMPSVVAVDHQTSAAIESSLGSSSSGQLFKVGHGQLAGAGGSQQSLDLFSHLGNDTVITSPSKNFEISSGAQMQLLVGVNKK